MAEINQWHRCRELAAQSHAQWGDDVLAWDYLGRARDGFFFEAGANDPVLLSQTCFLEEQGWRGVLVEPVPSCCEKLIKVRTRSRVFQAALGAPEQRGYLRLRIPQGVTQLTAALRDGESCAAGELVEAKLMTISEALDAAGLATLDFLSLDLEGMELNALRGLDFVRHAPRLIIMEDRMEGLAKHRFLVRHGYKIVMRNGSNSWYVPIADPFEVSPGMRWELLRKLYLSLPFRRMRDLLRKLRGK